MVCRSCRARLAKRRSGTRALLQKKGCKDSHHNGSDQGAAAAAAAAAAKASSCSQHTDIYPQDNELASFSAQQQLMMMYGHHQNSNEALLTLLSLPDDAAAEAAPGMQHSSSPGPIGAPARSLSDGTPMASASAAAAAAAANAAAAYQAISAPLYLLPRSGTGTSDAAGMPHQAAAADAAGCGGEDGPMGQAEVLKALQALEDPSDPLQRIQGSATSAVRAAACAGAPTPPPATGYPAAEITSCSVPLAQLDLGSSGALPKAVPAPGSPMRSAGGEPCKSAPLAGLGLGPSLGLGPLQHQASNAGQQQQGSMERASSRLKWLIQQLQQELDVCNPAELEALNNDELGTLLCAALAPATTNAAAAAGGDAAAAAAARGVHARATVPVKPDPAAASLASLMPPAQPCFSAGFAPAAMSGPALGPSHVSDLDLQLQKAHVQQLQQRVHQLQMQLHIRDGASSRPCDMQCATPPLAGNCPDMAAVYRGLSGMPGAQGVGGPFTSMQQRPLDSLLFGTGAASMSAPLQTTIMCGQHMPAGSMPAAAAAASQTRMDPNAAQWMGHGVGGGVSQPLAMPTGFSHVQQAQQRLQQVQQQAMSLQMAAASAGMQRQPDAAAAMQFMALQNQLRMVEEEMLSLMAQQSAAAR